MNYKIVGSTLSAAALTISLVVLCFYVSESPSAVAMSLTILISGISIGWFVAVLASPYRSEEDKFLGYKQAISAFLGGYILSKIDSSLAAILSWDTLQNLESGFRVILFASGFILSMIVTYVFRTYAR